jgi:hypothetical protein
MKLTSLSQLEGAQELHVYSTIASADAASVRRFVAALADKEREPTLCMHASRLAVDRAFVVGYGETVEFHKVERLQEEPLPRLLWLWYETGKDGRVVMDFADPPDSHTTGIAASVRLHDGQLKFEAPYAGIAGLPEESAAQFNALNFQIQQGTDLQPDGRPIELTKQLNEASSRGPLTLARIALPQLVT